MRQYTEKEGGSSHSNRPIQGKCDKLTWPKRNSGEDYSYRRFLQKLQSFLKESQQKTIGGYNSSKANGRPIRATHSAKDGIMKNPKPGLIKYRFC